MEYFCYISRSKVDQLFHQLAPTDVDEWTEQHSTEQTLGADVEVDWNLARIISLFKGGITYGRKGIVQREQKLKLHYVEKLRRVLLAIAEKRPIPSLAEALRLDDFSSLYYHHLGHFRVAQPLREADSSVVLTLQTSLEGTVLLLDCSLRFFSEGNEPDGKFIIHSSNSRFFLGEIPLQMETVFLLLHREKGKLTGTPLCLKLPSGSIQYL